MDHASRVRRLVEDVDRAILLTDLTNIRYLSGFEGSNAFMFVGRQGTSFVTDGRYGEVAESLVSHLPDTTLEVYSSGLFDVLGRVIGQAPSVDLEAAHVSWEFVGKLGVTTQAELHPGGGIVERYRLVKDATEVAALRAAALAGDQALAGLGALLETNATEADLGDALVSAMKAEGAGRASWPPIVASNANAARPHHRAASESIEPGVLLLDFGCTVAGYNSDMSRTFQLHGSSDPDFEKVYAAVLESNEAGIAAVGPGVVAGDVDRTCRDVLASHGYEEFFVHSTGHGVGLDVHEAPSVRRNGAELLESGNVVTVEPGVYLPGRFGVRIEDMVLVTDSGREVLTTSTKEPAIP